MLRRVLRIAVPVVGIAILSCIGSYLLSLQGGVSEADRPPASSEVESEPKEGPALSEKATRGPRPPEQAGKLTLSATPATRSGVKFRSTRVFSGSLTDYARMVEASFQASYRPPQTTGKPIGKAVVTVNIAPHGRASGFILRRSTDDAAVDRYIIKCIVKSAYPPAPYRPGENPNLEFTIDGAQVHVAVPSK